MPLIILIFLTSFTSMAIAQDRYYCGYYWAGYATTPPGVGVSTSIKTRSPFVDYDQLFAQWPTVMISYTYEYWVQVGYQKSVNTDYQLEWYIEKKDSNGRGQLWMSDYDEGYPSSGSTYSYYIYKMANGDWDIYVSAWGSSYSLTTSPNTIVDYQCFSETSDDSIIIDGTIFNYISYRHTSGDWRLWYDHYPREDGDYILTETYDYKFYGDGPP